MAVHTVVKGEFVSKKSLCETCGNAVPQLCVFIREKESESALASIGAEAVKAKFFRNSHSEVLYKVISCPAYIEGELPAMAHKPEPVSLPAGKAEKYDLSCPKCGSNENVKVAGIREFPKSPGEWYCRCFACNKSFRPRKKEGKEMDLSIDNPGKNNFTVFDPKKSRLEEAREKLTKKEYLRLWNEGKADKEIMAQHDISYNAFYQLKKEWGLTGQLVRTDSPQEKSPEKNHLAAQAPGDCPGTNEIEWAEPGLSVINMPVLRIYNNGISLNACAARSLQGIKYLRIGATKNGLIILIPSEEKQDATLAGRQAAE